MEKKDEYNRWHLPKGLVFGRISPQITSGLYKYIFAKTTRTILTTFSERKSTCVLGWISYNLILLNCSQ